MGQRGTSKNWASMSGKTARQPGGTGGKLYERGTCHCGAPGLRIVGRRTFCREHQAEAFELARRHVESFPVPPQ